MKYSEGSDSTFTHFGKSRKVDDLIAATRGHQIKSLNVGRLDWVFEYTTPDPQRVADASLHYPIIVTEDVVDGKKRYIVLDGLHRLAKAKQLGREYVKCYIVSKAELEAIPLAA